MQMGFAGKNDSECASSLEPWSNPSAWHQARCPNMPTRELLWRGDRLSASPQVRAEPGAIPLPKTHFDPALSKCESWCTPDVHMPGKSPSHCYASSCHQCDWCKGQPGSNVTNSPYYNPKSPDDAPVKGPEPSVLEHPLLLAMTLQDEDFEGGAPPVGAPTLSAVPSPLDATPEPAAAPGRSPLLYALASVGAAALAAAVGGPHACRQGALWTAVCRHRGPRRGGRTGEHALRRFSCVHTGDRRAAILDLGSIA